jgi:hypothetical protein
LADWPQHTAGRGEESGAAWIEVAAFAANNTTPITRRRRNLNLAIMR